MNNSIYLRRKNKLYLKKDKYSLAYKDIYMLLKNIESLGYTLSVDLIETVNTFSAERLKSFYKQFIHDLKEIRGANVKFEPMYPDFPEQVKEADEKELYNNAYWHYVGDWFGKRIMPDYEKTPRQELQDEVSLQVIEPGTKEDFNTIFTNLVNSKTSISETDKEDVKWFVKNYNQHVLTLLPEEIPLKENIGLLTGLFIENRLEARGFYERNIKTATDVLRVAVALSNGDISLAENTVFISFSRKTRKILLALLENCGNITEDMLRYKNRWKRLGEKLHPFEYKKRFPNCYQAFDIIRNDKQFLTFNAKVEKAIDSRDITLAIELLKTRPGEFTRRIDKLLRESRDHQKITENFNEIADKVSTPVLLQLINHFKNRNADKEFRTFFPKGNIARVKVIDNTLPDIPRKACDRVMDICEQSLIRRFRKSGKLGKVYLDEKLKNYTVPFSLRSASNALRTIPRGSSIELPPGDTVRLFIYWQNGNQRTDLDLSALALDDKSLHVTTISYYNLKSLGGYHSGDITSAPEGASEFIDIEIPEFLENDIRYVMMCINSYTWQPYCDLPVCFAGFMMRQYPESGEIYEPKTVENKFDLTADSKVAIPLILDLRERQVIWTDLSLKNNLQANNNVHNNMSSLTIVNKVMTTLSKPVLYDLFDLHIKARGEKTLDIKKADVIFATDKGITPLDKEKIISQYL